MCFGVYQLLGKMVAMGCKSLQCLFKIKYSIGVDAEIFQTELTLFVNWEYQWTEITCWVFGYMINEINCLLFSLALICHRVLWIYNLDKTIGGCAYIVTRCSRKSILCNCKWIFIVLFICLFLLLGLLIRK